MFDYRGKVVIVTGATGNLGSAVARAFLAAGAHLVPIDRNRDRQHEIFGDLVDSPSHFLASPVDLMSGADMNRVLRQAVQRLGRADVLVNTVGGFHGGNPLQETPAETWDLMMNLNARTVFLACQAAIPKMIEQGSGKIVNIASRAGLAGPENQSVYAASKSAVIRLTESMAAELRTQGINVNCVLPGTIDTPQNRIAMPKADYSRWVQA